jgi:hypothetical protein
MPDSLIVHAFTGQTFQIDNVPADATVSSLLSRLASLELPPLTETRRLGIRVADKILSPSDSIPVSEIDLIVIRPQTSPVKRFLVWGIFVLAHLTPFALLELHDAGIHMAITSYAILSVILALLAPRLRPQPELDDGETKPKGLLHELVVLFFWSFNPSFRLEQVLIHD